MKIRYRRMRDGWVNVRETRGPEKQYDENRVHLEHGALSYNTQKNHPADVKTWNSY